MSGRARGVVRRGRSIATISVGSPAGPAQTKIGIVADRLFCAIAAGRHPATRAGQSAHARIWDIGPQAPVHALVLPGESPDLPRWPLPSPSVSRPSHSARRAGPAAKSFGTPDGGVQIK